MQFTHDGRKTLVPYNRSSSSIYFLHVSLRGLIFFCFFFSANEAAGLWGWRWLHPALTGPNQLLPFVHHRPVLFFFLLCWLFLVQRISSGSCRMTWEKVGVRWYRERRGHSRQVEARRRHHRFLHARRPLFPPPTQRRGAVVLCLISSQLDQVGSFLKRLQRVHHRLYTRLSYQVQEDISIDTTWSDYLLKMLGSLFFNKKSRYFGFLRSEGEENVVVVYM